MCRIDFLSDKGVSYFRSLVYTKFQYSTHNLLSVSAMMSRGDSVSTTSPSTTTDNCQQGGMTIRILPLKKNFRDAYVMSFKIGNISRVGGVVGLNLEFRSKIGEEE